ncbi:DUF5686 family protein [Phaeodactylibacter xiamenensis]|uniref:DUF5686 family protein n=1 Tax=Phaeodactylibacter xiamenensis TaxID=1524460 RepID=UPI0024A8974C|nr:DUF5686 family protein [Phaeodactylibacter xiamenensis]
MKLIWTTFLLTFSTAVLFAQSGGLSGKVTGPDGAPLSYASIFVQETGTGTTTNEEGYYEIRLPKGSYQLVFQFLGYKTVAKPVVVGNRMELLNISLQEQPVQLEAVDVMEGAENPAYTIMRRAIAKASYHRQQLDAYSAEVYIKGSGRLKKIPGLLRGTLEKEGLDTATAFTSESVSIVEYERPSTFRERVISVYTNGDDRSTSPTNYINGSFYEPEISGAVSPLSPRAFAYYRFDLEGFFMDRGYGINKIKVTPRSAGDGTFEGYLYIVEDWWSIYSLNLSTLQQGIRFRIEQIYAPIEEKAWLPVSHKFYVEGRFLGFGFEYRYLATVSNYNITLNPDLDGDFTVIDEKLNKELAEQLKESRKEEGGATPEERLIGGEELTRKELRKLMREYERQEQQEQDEPEVVENREYIIDSTAYEKDSVYWATIRPVPLTEIEARSYEKLDSMAKKEKAEEEADSLASNSNSGKFGFLGDILLGSSYKVGENQLVSHTALLPRIYFNPVEGFSLHTDIGYAYKKDDRRFSAILTPRYAFARQKLTGKAAIGYSYGDHYTGVDVGRYIHRYNGDRPIGFFFNTYVNLFTDRNFIRLYEKDYLRLSHHQQFRENLSLDLSAEWANRYQLYNQTRQVWIDFDDRTYASNFPVSRELGSTLPEEERAFILRATLTARPWQKYKIYNGEREAIPNSSPTLHLTYRQGLEGIEGSQTDFSYLEMGIKHQMNIGVRGRLDLRAEAGLFLNNDYVGFADYRHFTGNQLTLTTATPAGSYRRLPYYEFSTMDRFAGASAHYQFRKLLATQLLEVRLMGIKENLFANVLTTPASGTYYEFGYSLDNILRFFRVEVVAGFDNGGYRDWGILVGIASGISGGTFSIGD